MGGGQRSLVRWPPPAHALASPIVIVVVSQSRRCCRCLAVSSPLSSSCSLVVVVTATLLSSEGEGEGLRGSHHLCRRCLSCLLVDEQEKKNKQTGKGAAHSLAPADL